MSSRDLAAREESVRKQLKSYNDQFADRGNLSYDARRTSSASDSRVNFIADEAMLAMYPPPPPARHTPAGVGTRAYPASARAPRPAPRHVQAAAAHLLKEHLHPHLYWLLDSAHAELSELEHQHEPAPPLSPPARPQPTPPPPAPPEPEPFALTEAHPARQLLHSARSDLEVARARLASARHAVPPMSGAHQPAAGPRQAMGARLEAAYDEEAIAASAQAEGAVQEVLQRWRANTARGRAAALARAARVAERATPRRALLGRWALIARRRAVRAWARARACRSVWAAARALYRVALGTALRVWRARAENARAKMARVIRAFDRAEERCGAASAHAWRRWVL